MTKEQLLSLWNADNWEVMSCGVYLTAHRAGKELHINCNDYTRSEERRVGKECRSRWSPYH